MIIGIDASRALRARRTGTERYALELIRHLLALPEAGEHHWRLYTDVPVEAAHFLERTDPRHALEIVVLPATRLWTHRALAAEITRRRPDVLFVPSHVLPFVPGRLPPCVVTVHDLGHRHFPEAHTRRQRLYLEAGTRWNAAAATTIVAVSEATAADLSRCYGTASHKIRVIYEAAGAPLPVTAADSARMQATLGLERPYGLFVGTLQPRKNIGRLVRAYAFLCESTGVGWDLVLAGGVGWHAERVGAEIAVAGHSESIRMPGYIDETLLPALYHNALFFAFPSLFEGFGLPILEAQSYGVPVLSSTHSSLPEVAGDAALLVDPTDEQAIADAMLRLSSDPALRQRLIEAGYANVRRFSWEKAARETLAVLVEAGRQSKG